MLAGEYVLGTLDAGERASVDRRRRTEPALDAAILAWERRLAPLDIVTTPVLPPPDLLKRIEARIGSATSSGGDNIVDFAALRRQLGRWRAAAAGATAIAASLLVFVGLRETVLKPAPADRYVAVFAKDDVLPAFYFTIDLKSRTLTIRPVGASPQQGKTYEMWIASDRLGPAPRSLGLVDKGLAPTTKVLASYDADLLQQATFGVSLEPEGGSPTGRPTAPALHAKLLPVTISH
jgi:anti-sigma-K factor RskA